MTLPTISPAEARRRLAEGSAVLIDIREPVEHAREAIPQARLASLSTLAEGSLAGTGEHQPAVIFHCQSGKRTADNAPRLKACGAPEAFILEGGLSGWKAAGFATRLDRTKPIELQRQVQIAAGTLVLLGLLLAWLASPSFILLPAFVGAGLVFAGISGWCGMAQLLGAMPWNRMR
jgi:rhodanese-related sulfurtransferase